MMTIEELIQTVAGGCQMPGCTHKHEPIVLTGWCHPKAGTWMTIDAIKRSMRVSCIKCGATVVDVDLGPPR